MPSVPAIRLELRRSRLQRALTCALLALAAVSLALAPWPAWLRGATLVLLVAGMARQVRRARAEPAPTCVIWRSDGSWWLSWPGGTDPMPAELHQARVVGALIALDLRVLDAGDQGRLALRLWPDSADADELRRLRIRLRNAPQAPTVG